MKKRTVRILTFCLVFCLIFSSVAFAATQESAYLSSYYASVFHKGNGIVNLDYGVYATRTMSKLGVSRIAIYKTTGTLAKTITSSTAGYSGLQTSNTSYYFHNLNIQLTSGTTYYMVVTFYAKDSSGSGVANYTTGTFTA